MDTKAPGKNRSTKLPPWLIPSAVFAFIVVFYFLTVSGGQCTRYEQKMSRMHHMRHYIDSLRTKEQLEKLHKNQKEEQQH